MYPKTEFKGRTPGLEKAIFDSGTAKFVEKFNEVIEELKIYVGKTYTNADPIINLLENQTDGGLKNPDDPDTNATETDIAIWKEKIKRYIIREEVYNGNKTRLYLLIWGQCTETLQTELKSVPEYKEFAADFDPIRLIKAIKTATHSFREQRYQQASAWRAMKTLYSSYMREGDSARDHVERINNHIEVLERLGLPVGEYIELAKEDPVY